MENDYFEYDGSPAFHKLGYDDVLDFVIKESKKKYMEKYREKVAVEISRSNMGGPNKIHKPTDGGSLRS